MVIQIPIEDWIDLQHSPQGDPLSLGGLSLECQEKVSRRSELSTERKRRADEYRPFLSRKKSLVESIDWLTRAGSWGATIAYLKDLWNKRLKKWNNSLAYGILLREHK